MRPLAAILCAAVAGCAAEEPPRIDRAISSGAEAPELEAVVALLSDGELFCSGTVIAPRVVLTATHCFAPFAGLDDALFEISFGPVATEGERIAAVDLARHPDWRFDEPTNDIALVALERDAPVTPLAPARAPMTDAEIDRDVILVGFGRTTEVGDPDEGIRRAGAAPIRDYGDNQFAVNGGAGAPSVCLGDSGGPALTGADPPEVRGVHSRGSCDSLSLEERVDIHAADFIDPFVRAHDDSGGCSTSDRPPAGLALLLLLIAVAQRIRPRSIAARASRRSISKSQTNGA